MWVLGHNPLVVGKVAGCNGSAGVIKAHHGHVVGIGTHAKGDGGEAIVDADGHRMEDGIG